MRVFAFSLLSAAAIAWAAQAARADLITNGDFEAFTGGSPDGWNTEVSGGSITQAAGSSPFTNIYPAGSSAVLFSDEGGSDDSPMLWQTFSPISGVARFAFDFKLASLAGDPWFVSPAGAFGPGFAFPTNFQIGGSGGTFSLADNSTQNVASLSAGTWYQVLANFDFNTHQYNGSITPFGGSAIGWSDRAFAPYVDNLAYVQINDAEFDGVTNSALTLDNVSVSLPSFEAVPEPGSFALTLLASSGLLWRGYRQRANRGRESLASSSGLDGG